MVLKLDSEVSFEPVTLNSDSGRPSEGQTTTVFGFGALVAGQTVVDTPNLYEVDIRVQNIDTCVKTYENEIGSVERDFNICAADSGRDSCQGDSGGKRRSYFIALMVQLAGST